MPLERATTQPSTKLPPLVRMTMRPSDIATVTPELEKACKELIEGVQMGGPYLPVANACACSSSATMASTV
jgi:hypothetical protein